MRHTRSAVGACTTARTLGRLVGWLFAATDAELETAAQAHEAQARQLRDPVVRAALRGAWQVVDPLRFNPGHRDPAAPLADLLDLAPVELAEQTRAELRRAGLDPDATGWPPAHG